MVFASAMTTIYFDITTSISWGGAPVGITRVEREIARRAAGRCASPVRYCFFHQATQRYYVIQPAFAERVLAGECWIALDDMRGLRLDRSISERGNVLDDMPTDMTGAEAVLALRSRLADLPLADLVQLREENRFVNVNADGRRSLVSVSQVVSGPVPMNAKTWIINGGLDWEHKNVRGMRKIRKKAGFKYLAIIYDIIPLLYPQYVVPFYVDLLKKYFGELFWTADYAFCISETTKADVARHLAEWRLPAMPLEAWPLGSDIVEAAAGTQPGFPTALADKKYLLYVSTIEPRKSHRTIVDAFEHGVRSGAIPDDAMCVFVGRVGWNTDNLVQEIRTNPLIADRVMILSGIPDEDLTELYRRARFVGFPSKYEGYGLSLVEAMALGKACLSSEAGSLREVGGTAPLYIDPIDLRKWSDALVSAFTDDTMIAELERRSLTEYTPVTWDDSADLFYGILNRWVEAAR